MPSSKFTTNRFDPETTIPPGPLNPEISEAFTVAPEVVYSPTVVQIKRLVPDRRCLKRAETAHTGVALGRTGVRAGANVRVAPIDFSPPFIRPLKNIRLFTFIAE